jgi:hypothetical protein
VLLPVKRYVVAPVDCDLAPDWIGEKDPHANAGEPVCCSVNADQVGRGEAGRLHPVPDQGGGRRGVCRHRGRGHLRQVARRRALAPGTYARQSLLTYKLIHMRTARRNRPTTMMDLVLACRWTSARC